MTEAGRQEQGGNFDPPSADDDQRIYINLPWPALALLVVLALAFAAQTFLLSEPQADRLVLWPPGLRAGEGWTLLSYMFLHAGMAHLLMNSASALAFAPPVARLFGERGRGPLLFFAFYLICGVVSGLGYCLVHWGGVNAVVGASGAISGLWAAASRLLGNRGLQPILSRPVITNGIAFLVMNVILAFAGFFAGPIAWEAHLFGYACGLVLVGPMARLAKPGKALST